jgi:hypothetical protein
LIAQAKEIYEEFYDSWKPDMTRKFRDFCYTDRHFKIQSILVAVNHEQRDPTIHQDTNTWRS